MNKSAHTMTAALIAVASLVSLGCEKQINFLKARNELNNGVKAFSTADYAAAAEHFDVALELDPELHDALAYKAYSYMMQYVPGGASAENDQMAQRAIDGFQEVLERDPKNELAVSALASLYFNMKRFEESKEWHRKRIALLEEKANQSKDGKINPIAADSYYTIGVIDWTKSYEPRLKVRADLGMKPEDPGPIKDDEKREELAEQVEPMIEEGMTALQKALEVNPNYADAMVYLNLLHREKADLADSKEEYEAHLAKADEWVEKTLDTRKRLAEEGTKELFQAE